MTARSDDTASYVSQFAAGHPQVRLIENPGNQGKGYAVRNGILNARGKVILFTDADLSSPISEAAKLFAALEKGADVAIGSRWLDPSLQFQRQSLKRQLMSRTFNLFTRAVLTFPYHDTQCGFKAFTRRAAEMIFPLQRITRWGFDAEIIYLAHHLKLKVAEVPVAWGHDEAVQDPSLARWLLHGAGHASGEMECPEREVPARSHVIARDRIIGNQALTAD